MTNCRRDDRTERAERCKLFSVYHSLGVVVFVAFFVVTLWVCSKLSSDLHELSNRQWFLCLFPEICVYVFCSFWVCSVLWVTTLYLSKAILYWGDHHKHRDHLQSDAVKMICKNKTTNKKTETQRRDREKKKASMGCNWRIYDMHMIVLEMQ